MRSEIKQERIGKIRDLVKDHQIQHFRARELYQHDSSQWPFDQEFPPPTRLAENIAPTLKIADQIRQEWGAPVVVVSGYRSPAYNELIGGAEDSQHQYFRALDLSPIGPRFTSFLTLSEKIIRHRRQHGEIIGFGRYHTSEFIHIDTGHYHYNRDWHSGR